MNRFVAGSFLVLFSALGIFYATLLLIIFFRWAL